MPEMTFTVRWPDGSTDVCYSPSTVVREHLTPGEAYTVEDFVARATHALDVASERVREKYGAPCSRAVAQSVRISVAAARFAGDTAAIVVVEAFA